MTLCNRLIVAIVLVLVSPVLHSQEQKQPVDCPGQTTTTKIDYEVLCDEGASSANVCTVDRGTYGGWVTFNEKCAGCHGKSATATPDKVDLLETFSDGISYDEFTFVLFHGRHRTSNPMPSWKGNCIVISDIDNLFRYLGARARGELPPGEPQERMLDREIPVVPVASK